MEKNKNTPPVAITKETSQINISNIQDLSIEEKHILLKIRHIYIIFATLISTTIAIGTFAFILSSLRSEVSEIKDDFRTFKLKTEKIDWEMIYELSVTKKAEEINYKKSIKQK